MTHCYFVAEKFFPVGPPILSGKLMVHVFLGFLGLLSRIHTHTLKLHHDQITKDFVDKFSSEKFALFVC